MRDNDQILLEHVYDEIIRKTDSSKISPEQSKWEDDMMDEIKTGEDFPKDEIVKLANAVKLYRAKIVPENKNKELCVNVLDPLHKEYIAIAIIDRQGDFDPKESAYYGLYVKDRRFAGKVIRPIDSVIDELDTFLSDFWEGYAKVKASKDRRLINKYFVDAMVHS